MGFYGDWRSSHMTLGKKFNRGISKNVKLFFFKQAELMYLAGVFKLTTLLSGLRSKIQFEIRKLPFLNESLRLVQRNLLIYCTVFTFQADQIQMLKVKIMNLLSDPGSYVS